MLHVHGGPDADDLIAVAGACARDAVALGQVWVRQDEAWLTPVSGHESATYWRRVTGLPYEPGAPHG